MKVWWLWVGVLVALLLLPGAGVLAEEPPPGSGGGPIYVNEDVSLRPGETFDGDLGIFGGNLDVSEGGVVRGDVFVTGGGATIAGRVEGSLTVMGGNLNLAETAQVQGDVFAGGGKHTIAGQVSGNASILFGELDLLSTAVLQGDLLVSPGRLQREPGAQVQGNVVTRLTSLEPDTPTPPAAPEAPLPTPSRPPVEWQLRDAIGRLAAVAFMSLVWIAIGGLVVLIWPRHTRRVSECIATVPAQSFGLGLLTFLLAAALELAAVVAMVLIVLIGALLMATVILIPVGLLLILLSWLVLLPVPIALAGGLLLGWTSLSDLIGRKLLSGFGVASPSPVGAALVGLALTVPAVALLWLIKPACCAWPFILILASLGLGSVLHTRFGRQGCAPVHRPAGRAVSEALPPDAMDVEVGRPDEPGSGI